MISSILKFFKLRLLSSQGNILAYIVMTMVIFGVLGVTMVSLFSPSITSSAVQNDTRRATYLSEAGTRYAMSELLSGDFSETTINNLNATEYDVSSAGKFKISVFSPWFEPESNIDLGSNFSDQTRTFDVQEGSVPNGFVNQLPTSASGLALVNYDYIDISGANRPNPSPSARALIAGSSEVSGNPAKFDLKLDDDNDGEGFVASRNETVSFAVKPFSDLDNRPLPVNLLLQPAAAKIFPVRNGAIEINRHNFYYDQAIDKATHVELTNVRPVKNDENLTSISVTATNDYVILSPRNRYIISEGHSGDVFFGNHMNYATGFADISITPPRSRKPDIAFEDELDLRNTYEQVVESSKKDVFFQFDNTMKQLVIGGGPAPSFGAVWFRDARSIGGVKNFCGANGCQFELGIRVFFIMDYFGNGDGFTFSLMNGTNNNKGSVGGDIAISELLGYAGDSRLDVNGTTFLDGTPSGEGIEPPKLAVEFDGRSNNQNLAFCAGLNPDQVNLNTRNDPDFSGSNRDTVQYVFWGNRNPIIAPCRANKASYDDNRHNVTNAFQKWSFDAGARVLSTPAVNRTNGTIYVGSGADNNDGRVFAINPDGSQKWVFNSPESGDNDFDSSPALDENRNIYIGSDDDHLYSISPTNGTQRWRTSQLLGDIEARPAVDETRNRVYVGTQGGRFYAINKDNGNIIWRYPADATTVGAFISSPAVDGIDGTVYVGSADGHLYAFNPDDGTVKWLFPSSGSIGAIESSPIISKETNPANRKIYFGSNDNRVYAINRNGSLNWLRPTSDDVVATTAVTSDNLTIYAGSNDGHLYALDSSNGAIRWRFPSDATVIGAVRSSPAIDSDGTVYFGTDGGKLYALNPDGTLKWTFPTSGTVGAIQSSPTIGLDGIVYVGSNDGNIYAIDPFAEPRNIRNLYLTATELGATTEDNWFNSGPWAVRVEIERAAELNGNGKYNYRLRTWMRQCGNTDCTQDMSGNSILGTFFEDTRIEYDYSAIGTLPLTQTVELTPQDNTNFSRLLFGFTSAKATGDDQSITIKKFQLSFIRPADPQITSDPTWPPP